MHFADTLLQAIQNTTPICVGIDPRIERIPQFIQEQTLEEFGDTKEASANAIGDFSIAIIDSVKDIIPAIKIQMAFFELYGSAGQKVFEEICEYAKEQNLIVIADGKRNDIGSTAEAYSEALLGKSQLISSEESVNTIDALTVTPYLGSDGILPFTKTAKREEKGVFVLVKTSNESSGELQDLPIGDEMLHEYLAQLVSGWGREDVGECGFSSLGAVVGATYSEEAKYLRSLMPEQIFLVPGYGAQGAGAQDVKYCFHTNGTGAIINASRSILFAYENNPKYSQENFQDAAREATLLMKKELDEVL